MDNTQNSLTRIREIISKGTAGSIVLPENASPDATAAACSLYLGLNKLGKSVTLVGSQISQNGLVGEDKIQSDISAGGDNLVVSFPYTDGAIDKVDYNIQGHNFNLIISPKAGSKKISPDQVKFGYSGGLVDFIITVDSPTLNNLGGVYADNQQQFVGHDIINIDRHLTNAFYGTVNLVDKSTSSISELILGVLQNLQVEIDRDMATNLYAGIAAATNNFTSYSVNADTFEHIANLLRMGAVKKLIKKPENKFSNMSINKEIHSVRPIEDVEKDVADQTQQNPKDWLKPKIFRGGGSDLI